MTYKTATTLKAAEEIAKGAKQRAATFAAKMVAINTGLEKKRGEITRGLQIAGLDNRALEKQVAESMKNHTKSVRAETEKARYALFKEINAANEDLSYVRTEMTEPKRIATSYMFGTNERAIMEAQVEKLGLGGLASLAKKAAATAHTPEGKLLAAVVAEACSKVRPGARPFEPAEITEAAFGEEAAQAKAHCQEAQKAFDVVRALNRSFETGQDISPLEKTRLGLEHGGNVLPQDATGEPEETNIQEMARGLAVHIPGLSDREEAEAA